MKNASGLTLIEICVAVVLLAVAILVFHRLFDNVLKKNQETFNEGDYRQTVTVLNEALKKHCSASFKDRILDTTETEFQTKPSLVPPALILSYGDADQNPTRELAQVGSPIGGGFRISEMKVQLEGKVGSQYFALFKIIARNQASEKTHNIRLIFDTTAGATENERTITACRLR